MEATAWKGLCCAIPSLEAQDQVRFSNDQVTDGTKDM
jgi:hypothetical protein